MGCSASSLHDNPAVSLCRDRCTFLDDALHHSYALADAHLAYSHSLVALGPTLHRFFDRISAGPTDSKASPPSASLDRSGSSSDSHIRFNSDSEEDDGDEDSESLNRICHNYQNHDYSDFSNGLFPAQPVHGALSPPRSGGGGSLSRPPPPPPPPPEQNSYAWDFLNLFDTYDKFEMVPDFPCGEFKEAKDEDRTIRDAEGNHGKEKEFGRNEKKIEAEKVPVKDVVVENKMSAKNTKNSVSDESKAQFDSQDVSEVMREVQVQFEKAAKSGNEVLKLLDVGRFRYHQKNSVYQVSSKVLHAVSEVSSESMECRHSAEKINSVLGGLDNDDDDMWVSSGNLSATLKKLCMWEKKLYDEVKAEEKLRMIQEKKARQLKHLDEKGAEAAHKVDEIRSLVRTICAKRNIAFQVVDKLSTTISELRDEELWPWIIKLIQGLTGMWKNLLECHKYQHRVVAEAKNLNTTAGDAKLNDACVEVTMQLRLQIRNWIISFYYWIDVQRCCVKALNGWLLKCLLYEPEETADGIVPFSPGRIGAPPVFVICDEWSQAMDRLSELEVIDAMEGFFTSVNQLLEHYNKDQQERVTTDKDMERKLKFMEKEEQKMQKIVQSREKKTILLTSEKRGVQSSAVHQSQVTSSSSSNLHLGLKQIFNAMENFAAKSVEAYDKLNASIVEYEHAQENAKAP